MLIAVTFIGERLTSGQPRYERLVPAVPRIGESVSLPDRNIRGTVRDVFYWEEDVGGGMCKWRVEVHVR